jgi:hypothetical protein
MPSFAIVSLPIIALAIICAVGGRVLKSRPRLSSALGVAFGIGFFLVIAVGFGGAGIAVLIQGIHRHNWTTIFLSIPFMVVGAAAAAGLIWGGPIMARSGRAKVAHPDEPWLWNDDWASGQIPDHAAGGAIGAWIFAAFWTGISIPALVGAARQYFRTPESNLLIASVIAVVFVAVGLWMIVRAIRATARAAHFGKSVLSLQTLPASPGGTLAGTIHLPRPLSATGPLHLHLTCTRRDESGDGSMQMTQWEDQQQLDGLPQSNAGTDIPVYFAIPRDVPPTTSGGNSRKQFTWQLEVTAPTVRVSYRSRFTVPVFHLDQPVLPSMPDLAMKYRHHDASPRATDLPGITISGLADGGCVIHLAAARNVALATFWTLSGAILSAAIVWMIRSGAPLMADAIAAILTVITDLIALNAWLASATITARPRGLQIDRGLPLLRRMRDIPTDAISDITILVNGQMGQITYYTLQARLEGKTIGLASGIRGKQNAEYLAAQIRQGLGIEGKNPISVVFPSATAVGTC